MRLTLLTALLLAPLGALQAADEPTDAARAWANAPVVANKIKDACEPVCYAGQRLDPASYLGRRVDLNFRTGLLYRYTGDAKYLRFCEYVVASFESPTGPKLISTLTTGSKRVCDIEDTFANRAAREMKFGAANGQVGNRSKGYEMLSCIIGLAPAQEAADTEPFLKTGIPLFTNDNATQRRYRFEG